MGFDALGRVQNWCHGDKLHVRLLPRAGLAASMPSISWGPSGRDYRGTADDLLSLLGTPTFFKPGIWKYGESVIQFDAAANIVGIQSKGELKISQKDGRGYLLGSTLPKR